MKHPSAELLAKIHSLNIRVYGLTSGKIVIGEVSQTYENGVELNYASTVSSVNDTVKFSPAAIGENVPTAAIIYSHCVEFESEATIRLKKYYLDFIALSKISGYTNENLNEQPHNLQPLDPKGYTEDYWKKLAGRLAP